MTQDFSTKSRRLSQFDHGDIYGPCDRRMMISGDSNEREGPLRVDATHNVGTSTSPDCHPFVASAGSRKATPSVCVEAPPGLPIGPTKGQLQATLVSTDAGDELPHSQIPMELEVEDQIRHLIKSDSKALASLAPGVEGHDGSVADDATKRRSTVIKISSTIVTTNNIGVKQLNAPSTGQDNDDDDNHDKDYDDKSRSNEQGARSSIAPDDDEKHRSPAVANLSKASVSPMNGAIKMGPADAVKYIPPNSEKSFSSFDDADAAADKNKKISDDGAKSLSSRGSGWGIRIGLRGGGETSVASNGTSGWGPPPNSGAGSGSGWGAPPPPNPVAAAAWGAPNPASVNPDENKPTPAAAPAPGPPQAPPSAMVPAPMGPPAPSSTATTSTSWAAAAGKGLPPPADPAPNHGTSKQLEQLNSVREALFSQDGWGGSNVKQDTSWDVGPGGAGDGPAAAKDSNTWGGNRNDGTELWKSNLTGVTQPPKQKQENPWAPANNTDFRTWGEEDSTSAPSNDRDDRDPYWRPNDVGNPGPPGGPFGPPKPKDDWNAPGGGWNDPRSDPRDAPRGPLSRDPMGGMRDQPGPGWGGGPPPQPRGMSGWGQGPSNPRNWNDESPQPQRRNPNDESGTGLWAKPHAQGPIGGNPGQSHWKEMPLPNTAMPNMRGPPGPPGPPARMVPPVGKDPWGPPGRWGDEPPSNWGPVDDIPKRPGDWGEPTGWPNRNPGPARIRGSPSWEDPSMDHPSAGGWGMKPVPPKHSLTKEFIWGSKQFHLLCEFGFRKEDVETALRATNMNVEDANDMLKHANVQRQQPSRYNDPMFNPSMGGDPDLMRRGNFPGHFPTGSQSSYPDPGPGLLQPNPRDPTISPAVGGSKMNGAGPLPGSMHPGGRPPTSQQPPTTQQLRLLVQQIQMAVQAGHLNPQILNQPLAPQTLILLNQLLQQIKALQSLQHTHMQAQQMGKRVDIAQLSVNITKTKQQISNLQNQISAQQANYLKQSSSAPAAAAPNPFHHQPSSPSDPMSSSLEAMRLTSDPPMTQDQPTVSTNGSRLNQWKLPNQSEENGFSKAPGGSAAKTSVTLPFDEGPWSNKSPPNSGWPETSKPDHGLNGLSDFGIPEFEPGKPWKGPGLKNPDEDPNLTPGSVAPIALSSDTKSNTTGSEPGLGLNSTWSFGGKSDKSDAWNSLPSGPKHSASASSLTPMGQDLWGKSGRGPTTSSPWPTPTSNGMAWSTGQNGMDGGTNSHPWLLLKNLTAQIDGSTLKTLCMQHGPLKAFHLFLNQSFALVMYTSGQEAAKAQKALNNCLLGNTTIHASITSESDAGQILSNLGGQPSSSTPSRGTTPASTAVTSGSSALGSLTLPKSSSSSDMWSALTATSASGGGGSLFGGSNSVWGAPSDVDEHRTTPLQSFLPSSLLGENNL